MTFANEIRSTKEQALSNKAEESIQSMVKITVQYIKTLIISIAKQYPSVPVDCEVQIRCSYDGRWGSIKNISSKRIFFGGDRETIDEWCLSEKAKIYQDLLKGSLISDGFDVGNWVILEWIWDKKNRRHLNPDLDSEFKQFDLPWIPSMPQIPGIDIKRIPGSTYLIHSIDPTRPFYKKTISRGSGTSKSMWQQEDYSDKRGFEYGHSFWEENKVDWNFPSIIVKYHE